MQIPNSGRPSKFSRSTYKLAYWRRLLKVTQFAAHNSTDTYDTLEYDNEHGLQDVTGIGPLLTAGFPESRNSDNCSPIASWDLKSGLFAKPCRVAQSEKSKHINNAELKHSDIPCTDSDLWRHLEPKANRALCHGTQCVYGTLAGSRIGNWHFCTEWNMKYVWTFSVNVRNILVTIGNKIGVHLLSISDLFHFPYYSFSFLSLSLSFYLFILFHFISF
jgi:hypothetical protein